MSIKQIIDEIKENKVIMRILWVLCLVLFVILFVRYHVHKTSKQRYNMGVNAFREGNYEDAEEYFMYALAYKHSKRFECKIRINEALSITTPITPDIVTPENLDSYIERLEYARDILTAHDCAHKNDSNGHSRKAQRLKEEIDDYIEFLKENNPPPEEKEEDKGGGGSSQDESDKEKQKREEEERKRQEEEKKINQKQMDLEKKFNQIEQQGLEERTETLELYQEYTHDFDYFSGKSW